MIQLLELYVATTAIILCGVSLFSAAILLGLPQVFKVKTWIKIGPLLGFISELTAGLLVYIYVGNYPISEFILIIIGLYQTDMVIKNGTFIYVHAVILRKRIAYKAIKGNSNVEAVRQLD